MQDGGAEQAHMLNDMTVPERRHEILNRTNREGRATVAELSRLFGVSEVTIRQDLQALAEQNLLVRTHGGAIPANRLASELSLALRRQQQALAKERIGVAGAAMIDDGDAVFLDTSSTALAIAMRLRQHRQVTVITNSIAIVQELMASPDLTVVVPGGRLRRETASLIGVDGLEVLAGYNIQKGFFGAHGLSLAEGLTDVSAEEADVKAAMAARCRQVIAVIDATKWGRVGFASFAPLAAVHHIITAADAPAELVERVRGMGITVVAV